MDAYVILRLLQTSGIGPAKVRSIIDWLENNKTDCEAVTRDEMVLRQILTETQLQSFKQNKERVDRIWSELEKSDTHAISISDTDYPRQLGARLGRKAPPVLFARGNLSLLTAPSVGFCGSRKASAKGLETTIDAAEQLASAAINVVSGYATGVDMAAHRSALVSGGTTSIVLAEGIQHFRVKSELRDLWDWKRTVVVSEFSPGLPWTAHNAMQRNDTICALSNVVIVVEAGESGGTMEAGKSALRLGVPLFVAVYENDVISAAGNPWLLRNGGHALMRSRASGRASMRDIVSISLHSSQPEGRRDLFRA